MKQKKKFNYEILRNGMTLRRTDKTQLASDFYNTMKSVCEKSPEKNIIELVTNFDERRIIKKEIFNSKDESKII